MFRKVWLVFYSEKKIYTEKWVALWIKSGIVTVVHPVFAQRKLFEEQRHFPNKKAVNCLGYQIPEFMILKSIGIVGMISKMLCNSQWIH